MIDFETEKKRSELYRNIRRYFDQRGYMEVFTPTLSPTLIPEPTIYPFKTSFISDFREKRDFYLIPSPEIFMKEMIANGSGAIYQISKCFRNNEQLGSTHNPEFTMLEFYTPSFTDGDSIPLTIDLIRETAVARPKVITNRELILTMEEAFKEFANVDLIKCQDISYLRGEAKRLGLEIEENESWEDTFNRIFLNYVELSLPRDRMVFLRDYPAQIECLAENYTDRPYKKRWEMYMNGIEVANTYTEETNKSKIKELYEREQRELEDSRRGTLNAISPIDPEFPELNMKSSSGGAIGLDRLLMANLSLGSISQTLPFSFEKLLSKRSKTNN